MILKAKIKKENSVIERCKSKADEKKLQIIKSFIKRQKPEVLKVCSTIKRTEMDAYKCTR